MVLCIFSCCFMLYAIDSCCEPTPPVSLPLLGPRQHRPGKPESAAHTESRKCLLDFVSTKTLNVHETREPAGADRACPNCRAPRKAVQVEIIFFFFFFFLKLERVETTFALSADPMLWVPRRQQRSAVISLLCTVALRS